MGSNQVIPHMSNDFLHLVAEFFICRQMFCWRTPHISHDIVFLIIYLKVDLLKDGVSVEHVSIADFLFSSVTSVGVDFLVSFLSVVLLIDGVSVEHIARYIIPMLTFAPK